jgi:AcrR family transcriptional regulator
MTAVPAPAATETRRDQILRTAAELFAQRGFRGVSINDIGAAVGVTGPALYRHFPSKEAVLGEMLVQISRTLLAEGERRAAQSPAGAATLEALVDWHVEFAVSQPALISVQYRDLDHLAKADRREVQQLQRRYVEIWVAAIRETVPAVDEAHARSAAHAVFGLINSTPHSARIGQDQMTDLLHRMAMAALAGLHTARPLDTTRRLEAQARDDTTRRAPR